MMIHTGVVMVRCPATSRELSTGVEMDAATFERLPDIRSRIKCPVCYLDYDWSTRDAWLGIPVPSAPALPQYEPQAPVLPCAGASSWSRRSCKPHSWLLAVGELDAGGLKGIRWPDRSVLTSKP